MATAQFPRQSGSRNPQRCVMGKGERGVISSCHGKARGRARFRHGSIQDPRMSAPRPLSGCHMLGQAAPAPEANGFSSCRLYIVPESKRGSGQPSTLPEAPPAAGSCPAMALATALSPSPALKPREYHTELAAGRRWSCGAGRGRRRRNPMGWECGEAAFSKGHRGYQEESKWLLGAKLQVNHSTHPTEGAEDSACWSTDASGRDVSPPTTAVTSGHRPQRAPRLISRWPRTV